MHRFKLFVKKCSKCGINMNANNSNKKFCFECKKIRRNAYGREYERIKSKGK